MFTSQVNRNLAHLSKRVLQLSLENPSGIFLRASCCGIVVTPHSTTAAFSTSSKRLDTPLPAENYLSWDTKEPVKLRMGEGGDPGNNEPILVQTLLNSTAEKYPDHIALKVKRHGEWQTWTYQEYRKQVRTVAKAFHKMGLQQYKAVGIMASNCPEWYIASLGAIHGGGLSTGIYQSNSPDLVSHVCNHAPIQILVLEDMATYRTILNDRPRSEAFPTVEKIVLLNGSTENVKDMFTWQQVMDMGEKEQDDQILEDIAKKQGPNQAALLLYTSGTTGLPKGAMLSHDNLTLTGLIANIHLHYKPGSETVMSYLPLSHVASQLFDLYAMMRAGGTVGFADKDALKGTLVDNLKEIRPTRFLGVPRVYEKIEEKMAEVAAQNGALKSAISSWAKSQSTQFYEGVRNGGSTEPSWQFKLANKLIFKKIHEALGLDRAVNSDGCYTAAAPISNQSLRYFESINIPLLEAYGATETTACGTVNQTYQDQMPGTVGKDFCGMLSKTDAPDGVSNGEILKNSRAIFMGYHGEKKKTIEAFTEDFWFRTGDIGAFDPSGNLTISGRLKEIIITAGGKNVAPIPIEDNIKEALKAVVSNVVVVGEKKKYLTSLLTLRVQVDPVTLLPTDKLDTSVVNWAKIQGCPGLETIDDFINGPHAQTLRASVERSFKLVNSRSESNVTKVQKFAILPQEFSVPSGELGPTLKLKRFFVYDKYASYIDAMYDAVEEQVEVEKKKEQLTKADNLVLNPVAA